MIHNLTYIAKLLLICLLMLSCDKTKQENKQNQSHPNIIYILADNLGYGNIGVFNLQRKIRTPNIDQLVARCIKLTQLSIIRLKASESEQQNLHDKYPETAEELKKEMTSLIKNERSTQVKPQPNDPPLNGKPWFQITQFTNKNNSILNQNQ
ncbi:MAG: hypothetical protein ACK5H1_04255 [Tenacibaculum sp.]